MENLPQQNKKDIFSSGASRIVTSLIFFVVAIIWTISLREPGESLITGFTGAIMFLNPLHFLLVPLYLAGAALLISGILRLVKK